MQKVILKEAQAPYQVALSDALFTGEVVILEKNGQAVAAVVPMADYDAFLAWRAAEARKQQVAQEEAAIAREHQAFQRMLPELLSDYRDRVVAIYQGEVIGVGDDRMDVWQRAATNQWCASVCPNGGVPTQNLQNAPSKGCPACGHITNLIYA